jgi:hypothetical protein
VLGALRLGTEKGHVLNAAITALLAIEKKLLHRPFQHRSERPAVRVPVEGLTNRLQVRRKRRSEVEEVAMEKFHEVKQAFVYGRQGRGAQVVPRQRVIFA